MPPVRLDRLTTLRGIAAWWVVLYHFREPLLPVLPQPVNDVLGKGFLAVDFFFLLSGFIVGANYLQKMSRADRTDALLFMQRRIARIYPLHLAVLVAYLSVPLAIWCCSSQGLSPDRFSVPYFFQSVVLIQNWGFSTSLDWNIPAWSISAEFAAYVVFAVLGVSGLLGQLRWGHAVLTLLICWLAIVALFTLNGAESIGNAIPTLGLGRCIAQFLMGVSLWVIITRVVGKNPLLGRSCLLLALILLAIGIHFEISDVLLISPIAALVIAGLSLIPEQTGRGLTTPALVHVGEISYSTYLIHDLVKQWVKFAFAEAGVLTVLVYLLAVWVISEASFRWLEKPARDFLNARAFVRKRIAT